MTTDLLAAARRIRVIAFFAALAWLVSIDPPGWQRLLLAALALAAVAADVFLDEHLRPAKAPNPSYDKAA